MKNYFSKIIGLIAMGKSAIPDRTFHTLVPSHVGVVTTRVPFNSISKTGLNEMLEHLPSASKLLMQARPNVIVLPSAGGSYIKGNEIINTIHQMTGVPVVIPSQQYSDLLRRIGATKIILVSSFAIEWNLLATLFFDGCGITVVDTIQIQNFIDIDPFYLEVINTQQMLDRVSTYDFSGVDAVIIDNPVFTFDPDTTSELERYIKVPMFDLLQVLIFGALEKIGESTDKLYISKFFK